MLKLKLFITCLVFLLFATLGCTSGADTLTLRFENSDNSKSPVLFAETAQTPAKRSIGLMYRRDLAPNQAMLFIFPDEEPRKFWMKNTYVELDMIFINSHFKVVSLQEKAIPLTSVERLSNYPAKYVLEVRGGSAKNWGVKPGSLMKVESGEIMEGQ